MGQVVLCILVGLLSILSEKGVFGNDPPVFTKDLANHIISEATEVGTVVGKLEGYDPEGSVVHFSISGTDRLQVDRDTGDVTLVKPLDHEEKETLEFSVGIEDVVDPNVHSGPNNLVEVPVTFIILDENDNAPFFKNTPYMASLPEDTDVGTTIFHNIVVEDDDLSGDTLEVSCSEDPQFPNTCAKFDVQAWNANQSSYLGGVVLKQPVDYSERPFFRVLLSATDGQHTVTTGLEVKVQDIQNTPPVFQGSLTGVIQEDDPIGTLVMTVQARDGDKGQPRKINYQLLTNPLDYFLLDSETGELRTAKPLDREALKDSTGVISLTIIAREIVNGVPSEELMTSTTAVASVTIKDVNDEPPTFNEREYTVSLPENIPDGTPIPNLDMTVTDPDIGANSAFSLRLSDLSGAFSVEPASATGSTSVSIRVVNGSLDYENPNTRKFIILVIAEETETNPKLSSTATVTVQITDENDNPPQFDQEVLSATVSETASSGHVIANFTAMDRDSGRYGADGIVYELVGDGAEKFQVNRKTGVITVAPCDKPGAPQCLDFETKPVYFLSYQAKDDEGQGLSSVVPLKISLFDSNDNPPEFTSKSYSAVIDEGASKFEPPLQVQAKDADKTTELEYSIIDGNEGNLFTVDLHTGEIMVADPMGLDMSNVSSDYVHLVIQAGDGIFTAKTLVNITVLDVNNNHPVFERESYVATVKEDSPIGTTVEKVNAEDADSGINANLVYRIEKGAFDDFAIDNMTGVITVASKLDYDLRMFYAIQVIAVDGGTPALTGTTTVSLNIENSNDKAPFFAPPTQRAEVGEDAEVGSVIYKLIAKDLDVNSSDALNYFASEPITAVDKNGKEVVGDTSFKDFFTIDQMTGKVIVAKTLQRDVAAVVRITVIVSDITAPKLQQGKGTLVVTIIDVNDFPPVFTPPWSPLQPYYSVDLLEEQPVGTLVGTFTATDPDSNIANYVLQPESEYFEVQNTTGAVRTIHRIDYEETPKLNFTIVAYDSGVPQFSASAMVFVNVININDIDPVFNQSSYSATIQENAPQGTIVARVKAVDKDSGVFGKVTYSLIGEHSSEFNIDYETGEISVAKSTALDRENREEIILQVMASDGAPPETRRIISVPVTIKLLDVNDNPPTFTQHNYIASIVENIPPSPIVQLRAQDKDLTSELHYKIVSGNDGDVFKLDPVTGILTPAVPLIGKSPHYTLTVEVSDGTFTDTANVEITILDVNQHSPVFITPTPSQNATIHISENDVADMLVMTVQAFDNDSGKNGHVTYHFKVNNSNVQETEEFSIDPESGELRAKIILDRETRPSYQLVLVARDQATPTWHEALQFLTIVLKDVDDNFPEFPAESNSTYIFKVMENTPARRKIGKVEAKDIDEGENSKVYYYIISGNEERKFSVDRLDGIIMTNGSLDRETQNFYELFIKATNDPDYYTAKDKDATKTLKESSSVARVQIIILDENDNPPVFERITYYAGVNALANPGQLIAEVIATDLDAGENGSITYQVVESHLFKAGSNVSSGSVVPSPFNITNNGRLKTATLVAEYNQVRFRLDVVARETAHPHREARATVHVWIYEDQQLIRVILSRPPEEVNQERDKIIHELSNATQSLVIVDEIRYHTDASGHKQLDWCDMFLHVVDNQTLAITSIPEVLKVIDAQYDFLKDYYAGFAIENVIPAHVGKREETFEPALAALIALLVVLFVGCVSVIVVCCCFRHWVVAEPIDMKSSDTLIKKAILDDLNTTENPLWIEQKLKLYEEQELTMQVFCEPESGTQIPTQATMERRDSGDMSVVDNTYDTIQHPARRGSMNTVLSLGAGDYATLGGSLLPLDNVSSHSQQMYEAALGFQGSTFQVPESGDLFRPRSELRVNKDGQPEFVSELI